MPGPMDQYLQMMQQRAIGAPPPMAPMQPQQMPQTQMPAPAPNPLAMLSGIGSQQMPGLPSIGQLAQPQMGMPQLPQMQIPMPPTGPLDTQMPNFTSMLQQGQSAISQAATRAAQVPLPPPPKPQAVAPAAAPRSVKDMTQAERLKIIKEGGEQSDEAKHVQLQNAMNVQRDNARRRKGGSNK